MVERRRRSVTVAGHSTSVALDPVFWELLAAMARARNMGRDALITEVDGRRGPDTSLASALRVAVLEAVQAGVIESDPQAGS